MIRLSGCLEGMNGLITALEFDVKAMEKAASSGATWATDAAEELVRQGVPFREAHERTAKRVADLETGDADTSQPHDPATSVAARGNRGGTAPDEVRRQIEVLRSRV